MLPYMDVKLLQVVLLNVGLVHEVLLQVLRVLGGVELNALLQIPLADRQGEFLCYLTVKILLRGFEGGLRLLAADIGPRALYRRNSPTIDLLDVLLSKRYPHTSVDASAIYLLASHALENFGPQGEGLLYKLRPQVLNANRVETLKIVFVYNWPDEGAAISFGEVLP